MKNRFKLITKLFGILNNNIKIQGVTKIYKPIAIFLKKKKKKMENISLFFFLIRLTDKMTANIHNTINLYVLVK